MNSVFIDIYSKPSTIYPIGTQGDDKATKLVFTNLPSDGRNYSISLLTTSATFKNVPFSNNEFVITSQYTKSYGFVSGQIYVNDGDVWKAFSPIFVMSLDKQLSQDLPKPEPGLNNELVYLPYKPSGASILGIGPCLIQNEKTDVVLAIKNYTIEIDCFAGHVVLTKKIEDGFTGDFGFFCDTYGKLNILSFDGSTITKRYADDLGHEWGFLSVSSDNKTLTKLEFVNGLTTGVVPKTETEITNKLYVDGEINKLGLEFPSSNFGSTQSLNPKVWKPGLVILGYNGFKQKASFYFDGDIINKFKILGGYYWVLKEYEHAQENDLIGSFLGNKDGDLANLKSILVYKKGSGKTGIEWKYNETFSLNDFK